MGAVLSPAELLQEIPLYRRLPPEERQRLAAVSRVKAYSRGEKIFSEGDASEIFYTIARGRVKIFKMTPAGKDLILEIFGPGDPFGAVAVYESRPYPASAMALEDSVCLLIRRQDFFGLLERHPSLVRSLLLGLTRRLVELTNRLAELTGGHVEPRFARLFLKLAGQMGKPVPAGTFIPLHLTRQELADLTGTTIETCIRIMSRWGKDGLVQTEKDGFVVIDCEALEALGRD
ncbi:MAG: Crp/Fnr family transcriptional regulator [Thermoanaerobaculia bacterium]